jgi:hypothetical protein
MVIVKATDDSEAGVMPTEQQLADMTRFNEELANAGMMLAGEGLHPSSRGARINWAAGKPAVTDGPFAETKELIAGFWILQASSKDEVIEWMKRCPGDENTVLEIRQVFEAEDFGDAFTPELQAQEQRIRDINAGQQGS